MRAFTGSTLIQRQSDFNNEYYCMIEKVEILPGIIRVFIDERGDNSLGPLQDPMFSSLGIVSEGSLSEAKQPTGRNFSVSDESRQYLGYLDFATHDVVMKPEDTIGFQYGMDGYSVAKLFRLNQELINTLHTKST